MNTTKTPAGKLCSGYTVHFTTGRAVPIEASFGTGDGTITLFFNDGANQWHRRVPSDMILNVSVTR